MLPGVFNNHLVTSTSTIKTIFCIVVQFSILLFIDWYQCWWEQTSRRGICRGLPLAPVWRDREEFPHGTTSPLFVIRKPALPLVTPAMTSLHGTLNDNLPQIILVGSRGRTRPSYSAWLLPSAIPVFVLRRNSMFLYSLYQIRCSPQTFVLKCLKSLLSADRSVITRRNTKRSHQLLLGSSHLSF